MFRLVVQRPGVSSIEFDAITEYRVIVESLAIIEEMPGFEDVSEEEIGTFILNRGGYYEYHKFSIILQGVEKAREIESFFSKLGIGENVKLTLEEAENNVTILDGEDAILRDFSLQIVAGEESRIKLMMTFAIGKFM